MDVRRVGADVSSVARARRLSQDVGSVVRAAAVAAVFSGLPSTVWAVATGNDPLAATLAAGAIVRPPSPVQPASVVWPTQLVHPTSVVRSTRLVPRPAPLGGPMVRPRVRLVGAAVVVHMGLSLGWTVALSRLPRCSAPQCSTPQCSTPRRSTPWRSTPRCSTPWRSVAAGALAGLGIAAVDLGLAHVSGNPRLAAVRALPVLPQLADHVAFGAIACAALGRSRL